MALSSEFKATVVPVVFRCMSQMAMVHRLSHRIPAGPCPTCGFFYRECWTRGAVTRNAVGRKKLDRKTKIETRSHIPKNAVRKTRKKKRRIKKRTKIRERKRTRPNVKRKRKPKIKTKPDARRKRYWSKHP